MTDMMSLKEPSAQQLRLKLTGLGHRVDELEEATRSLHRMEDEIMDLQDKVIQVEGSNSGLLGEVDLLRRRVLAAEGKDEEVRKAEDMCRRLREKLEGEERLGRELKAEVEALQDRMAELEKLEGAFGRSKSDCTQLSLSLNEEKNLTRKLTTELELLRLRVRELESSETRLDKSERSILAELEKLKSLTVALGEERKAVSEALRASERRVHQLTTTMEANNRISAVDQGKNSSNLRANVNVYGYTGDRGGLRIEENMSTELGKGGLDSLTISHNVGLREKEGQEDNKIKDLTQEIRRLKKRLTFLEMVEEDLKKTEAKHNELQERFLSEQTLATLLGRQLEDMRQQMTSGERTTVGNGQTSPQESRMRSRLDSPKHSPRGVAEEPQVQREKVQEVWSQPRSQREKVRNPDLLLEEDHVGKSQSRSRRPLSPNMGRRFQRASSNPRQAAPTERRFKEKPSSEPRAQVQDPHPEKARKTKDPPAVLSRYPPAANESNGKRPWGAHSQAGGINGTRGKPELDDSDQAAAPDRPRKALEMPGHERPPTTGDEGDEGLVEPAVTAATSALLNGTAPAFITHSSPPAPAFTTHSSPRGGGARNSFVVEFDADDGQPAPPKKPPGTAPAPAEPEAEAKEAVTTRGHRLRDMRSYRSHDLGLEYTAVSARPEHEHNPRAGGDGVGANRRAGLEVRRVCSPREGLRSKAVIKPAIIAIDKKEVMSAAVAMVMAEPGTSRQPSPPTPPLAPNKVTSSITILPSELSSHRPANARAFHTSTSNITIGPGHGHGEASVTSIRRSDIIAIKALSDSGSSSDEDQAVMVAVPGPVVSTRVTVAGAEQDGQASYMSRGQEERGARAVVMAAADPAARRERDLGLDYSRLALTPRRTSGDAASPTEAYSRRLSNFSNSSDSSESRRSPMSELSRSFPSTAAARQRQLSSSTVASKVANWNNSCAMTGQESSDLLSALNSSVMSKRKEMAKQILSELVTDRGPRADAAGKRQSVKLELRRNPEGSPTHPSGPRTEDTAPVGILSQIRMTSRR
ncbi:leucine zipper protein 1 [Rhinoraja longicauda]